MMNLVREKLMVKRVKVGFEGSPLVFISCDQGLGVPESERQVASLSSTFCINTGSSE